MDMDFEFLDIIEEHSERTGFHLPVLLALYMSRLLETKLEQSNLVLEPQLSDCLLASSNKDWMIVKNFADQCLFYSSLDPYCNEHNSAVGQYWANIGQQAYRKAGNQSSNEMFYHLAEWFIPLQQFLSSMVQDDVSVPGLEIFKSGKD